MLEVFPAEHLLSHEIPNHEQEWKTAISRFMITTFCFVVLSPIVVNIWFSSSPAKKDSPTSNAEKQPTTTTSTTTTTKRRGKGKRSQINRTKSRGNDESKQTDDDEPTSKPKDEKEVQIPSYVFPCVNIVFMIVTFVIVALLPQNSYSARRVFVAPLLKIEECQEIIKMASAAANRRAEKAQKTLNEDIFEKSLSQEKQEELQLILNEPRGYTKDRHKSYPTTDLNVVEDFTSDDNQFLTKILDTRLSPILERLYGISRDSIRANDIFVVRYDSDYRQSLNEHTDSSHVSFNVLLNDGFDGGGTRFHNRQHGTYDDVKPKPGEVIINNALVSHEGLATTEGTRYIMVGFMNIDRMDPFNGSSTALSRFSSWLSFPWMTVTIKDGWEVRLLKQEKQRKDDKELKSRNSLTLSNAKYVDYILHYSVLSFASLCDAFASHGITTLVEDSNYDSYISILDDAADNDARKANWLKGQNIQVALDGMVGSTWKTRLNNPEAFTQDL